MGTIKTIGIIGSGNIGQAVARHFLKAGYSVILSNSKGAESLHDVVDLLGTGAVAGTVKDAASADIVLLSLPWSQVPSLTSIIDWTGRIVIDATNHFITFAPDFKLAEIGDKASSEVVAGALPGAHVVKAFNTLYFKILREDPKVGNGNRVLFISGDHEESKKIVGAAIEGLGFSVIDLGSLSVGSKFQQPKAALATLNLVKIS